MASITIEASKVARKSPIRVDTSLVGTVSGVEAVNVSLPSSKARLSVGKLGYSILLGVVTSHLWQSYLL